MNLEQLKERLAAQVTVVDGVRLAKLNAVDGMTYGKRFQDIPDDADFALVAEGYAFLLSKCIVDDNGNKTLDSDEGRESLLRLDRDTFTKLGEAAIAWNLGDSKKN